MKKSFLLFSIALIFQIFTASLFANTWGYTLSFRDDPATTMVIGWSGDDGTVHHGLSDQGTNHLAYTNSQASDRSVSHKGQDRHFVRLTGLQPATVYYFVIYDNNSQVSGRFKFQTLSNDPTTPLSFVSGGDSRQSFELLGIPFEDCPSAVGCRGERQEGNQLVAKVRPDFVAFNGDFVRNNLGIGVDDEWTDWLDDWQLSIAPDGRMTPLNLVQGNHEDNTDMYNLFDIPQDEFYAMNFHGGLMRLYSLNSELNPCSNTDQLNWMVNDFQNHTGTGNDPIWKVTNYHVPVFAMANGYGLNQEQMTCWVDKFEQYGVRLSLESHSHTTKWSYPMLANAAQDDFVRNDTNGIVYIGEGQWGAPHRELDFPGGNKKPYIRSQDVFDSFFFIKINPDTISIQAVRFDNVAAVSTLTDDQLGSELPGGVQVWNPATGDELLIFQTVATGATEGQGNLPRIAEIYPIPSAKEITIKFNKVVKKSSIEIYNSLGKQCFSEVIKGKNSFKIDISKLCNGVNYIYIKDEKGHVESHKIIKTE